MRRFFLRRYNQKMGKTKLICILSFAASLLILLITLKYSAFERVELPISTGWGASGHVSLSLPTKVYAGDKGKIQAIIKLEGIPDVPSANLLVRVEAGFDEISPIGVVNVSIRSEAPVRLEWIFRVAGAANYPATLWLWLETGERQELLLAKEFRVESVLFLGSRIATIRIAAGIVGVLSLAWLLSMIFHKPN